MSSVLDVGCACGKVLQGGGCAFVLIKCFVHPYSAGLLQSVSLLALLERNLMKRLIYLSEWAEASCPTVYHARASGDFSPPSPPPSFTLFLVYLAGPSLVQRISGRVRSVPSFPSRERSSVSQSPSLAGRDFRVLPQGTSCRRQQERSPQPTRRRQRNGFRYLVKACMGVSLLQLLLMGMILLQMLLVLVDFFVKGSLRQVFVSLQSFQYLTFIFLFLSTSGIIPREVLIPFPRYA